MLTHKARVTVGGFVMISAGFICSLFLIQQLHQWVQLCCDEEEVLRSSDQCIWNVVSSHMYTTLTVLSV